MITLEKLKIYDKFGGDIDHVQRVGSEYEKKLFENRDWSIIDNGLQDVHLITNRLVAQSYIDRFLKKLKEDCDPASFDFITNKIPNYSNFQKVAAILRWIKGTISGDTNTIWTHFDNPPQILNDLNTDIERIEFCDFETLEKVRISFLPTGTYQELSISNGWGNDFLEIAKDFDNVYSKIEPDIQNKLTK